MAKHFCERCGKRVDATVKSEGGTWESIWCSICGLFLGRYRVR